MLMVSKGDVYSGFDNVICLPERNSLPILLSGFRPVARVKVRYLSYCLLYMVTENTCIINSIGGSPFGNVHVSGELCRKYDQMAEIEQLRFAGDGDFALHQRNMIQLLDDFVAEVLNNGGGN